MKFIRSQISSVFCQLKNNISSFLVLGTLSFSATAFAQELQWKLVSAQSMGNVLSCNLNNIQMLAYGGDLSLIFENMHVRMRGGDGTGQLQQMGICNVGLHFTLPRGTYLTQSSNLITGGVEKSANTTGAIDSTTTLARKLPGKTTFVPAFGGWGQVLYAKNVFSAPQAISQALVQLSALKTFTPPERTSMCAWTKSEDVRMAMQVQLRVMGTRQNGAQTAIIAVDAADTHFDLGMRVTNCP